MGDDSVIDVVVHTHKGEMYVRLSDIYAFLAGNPRCSARDLARDLKRAESEYASV